MEKPLLTPATCGKSKLEEVNTARTSSREFNYRYWVKEQLGDSVLKYWQEPFLYASVTWVSCMYTLWPTISVGRWIRHLTPAPPIQLSLSFPAVLFYVVLGVPCLRCLSGGHVIAVLQLLSYPFLIMCPMNFHLLLLTSSPTFSISAISITSLLVILLCQHNKNIIQ